MAKIIREKKIIKPLSLVALVLFGYFLFNLSHVVLANHYYNSYLSQLNRTYNDDIDSLNLERYIESMDAAIAEGVETPTFVAQAAAALSTVKTISAAEKPRPVATSIIASKINLSNIDRSRPTASASAVWDPNARGYYGTVHITGANITRNLYYVYSSNAQSQIDAGRTVMVGKGLMSQYGYRYICAHNTGSGFRNLVYARAGDKVTITTNFGIFVYRIKTCVIANAVQQNGHSLIMYNNTEVSQLTSAYGCSLFLYTCYPIGVANPTQRYVCFAYLESYTPPAGVDY